MAETSPEQGSEPDDEATPVPNRRERRGKKSKAPQPQGTGPVHRHLPPGVQRRQFNTRRRGGR